MTKRLLATAGAILLAGLVAPAAGQGPADLATAIQAGLVGERYDGYLGFAASAPAAVQKQVGAINIRRRTLYISLASRRGVTPQVAALATACQLLARVGVGQSYMLADGAWRRRGAGDPAPAPDYCRK